MVDEVHMLIGHGISKHLIVILTMLDVCKLECLSSSEVMGGTLATLNQ
jgi:hypothetical protein